ncbi:uncharacterized protein C21orf62 homolog [Sarcophilus harrisii]|uniref:Exosomal polycystin 1 interacting protein n=1 Tax=Sarcophilus harrisii TaxID=9305 RepID=A0A7N4P0X7_SARHA|nr:uncharacterized protein C21orf62 homolog [Sarcophilus harrisii]
MSVIVLSLKKMALPFGQHLLLMSFFGFFAYSSFVRGEKNNTLIFTKENTIRNCSCSADIRDCDYNLANLMCTCKTVLPYTIEQASYDSDLTIWFTDITALGFLLNFTLVRDLKLSLCSTTILPTEYLTIWGLKRLRINTEVKDQFPEQSLLIHTSDDSDFKEDKPKLPTDRQTFLYVSFLDTALFNGESSLKSYSIENVVSITNNFPYLSYFKMFSIPSNKSYIVTFIY